MAIDTRHATSFKFSAQTADLLKRLQATTGDTRHALVTEGLRLVAKKYGVPLAAPAPEKKPGKKT